MPLSRELSQLASVITVKDDNKSVGINSSIPSAQLDVGGDANIGGDLTATSFYGDGSNLSNLPSSGISDIVNDTTPQLGGNLDLNNKNITGTGNIDITGNVTVAGVLTYEDVTNIDSIGIATARVGLRVLAGGINAVGVVTATSFSGDGSALTNLVSINNLVEDTTPQLGGTLDANGNTIDMGTNIITDTKVGQWDTAYGWGDHSTEGYLTSLGVAAGVTSCNFTNWDTAYGWGNHASGGYLTSETFTSVAQDTTPQLGGNLDLNSNNINGTGNINITGSGTFSATVEAQDFNSLSDITLKDNISIIDNALDMINNLDGISWNWKNNGKASLGVSAQNVEEVAPELVSNTDHKAVNYNGLIGILIQAIKEQQVQINNLKKRLDD